MYVYVYVCVWENAYKVIHAHTHSCVGATGTAISERATWYNISNELGDLTWLASFCSFEVQAVNRVTRVWKVPYIWITKLAFLCCNCVTRFLSRL